MGDNMDVIGERIRAQEKQIDEHEKRLNNHENRLQKQEEHSASNDVRVETLCDRMDGVTKALWAVAAAVGGAVLTFFVTMLQRNLLQ